MAKNFVITGNVNELTGCVFTNCYLVNDETYKQVVDAVHRKEFNTGICDLSGGQPRTSFKEVHFVPVEGGPEIPEKFFKTFSKRFAALVFTFSRMFKEE